jgi:hypothetical protein
LNDRRNSAKDAKAAQLEAYRAAIAAAAPQREAKQAERIAIAEAREGRRAEREREKLIQQLQGALADVKTLRGLLLICGWCKQIRDDQGYYHRIEAYISAHSEARFIHGICPDCARQLERDLARGS